MQETIKEIISDVFCVNLVFKRFSKIFSPSRGSQGSRFRTATDKFMVIHCEKNSLFISVKIKAITRLISGPAKAQTASFLKLSSEDKFLSIRIPKGVISISFGFSPKITRHIKCPVSCRIPQSKHKIKALLLSKKPKIVIAKAKKKLIFILISLNFIVI